MKIAVIGAGAIGTVYGGFLARDGNDVTLVHHRPEVATEINDQGICIEDQSTSEIMTHEIPMNATVDATSIGTVDLAIVLVPSYRTLESIQQHSACIGPNTTVLSLQNGITNHYELRDVMGADRTLNGITRQSATSVGPGRVIRTGNRVTIFGGQNRETADTVASIFKNAKFDTRVAQDPFYHIWKKQILGGGLKPLAALTRLPNGEIVSDERLSAILRQLMLEMGEVAQAKGYSIDAAGIYQEIIQSKRESSHKSSMLQAVESGRRTEIEECNGAIVQFGEETNIDVTTNRLVTALVRGLEHGYLDKP